MGKQMSMLDEILPKDRKLRKKRMEILKDGIIETELFFFDK